MRTILEEHVLAPVAVARPVTDLRVATDGKFFRAGAVRFPFRGVTYGTFMTRSSDGARFPERLDRRPPTRARAR